MRQPGKMRQNHKMLYNSLEKRLHPLRLHGQNETGRFILPRFQLQ